VNNDETEEGEEIEDVGGDGIWRREGFMFRVTKLINPNL
jgi:hypothetical protein